MSAIWLTVECAPGSDIASACKELCELATRMNIHVHAPFNGVLLMASPGDSWTNLERSWGKELKSKRSYKLATAQRGAK